MNENNERTRLSLLVIFGASECAQIKTKRNVRIQNKGEPVAQYTKFEWTIGSRMRNNTKP